MPDDKTDFKYTADIRGYQEAVWDFLMEHCEVLNSGAIFIKFHTDGRQNFENRILSRWKYNYHREDPKSKQSMALDRREHFQQQKAENQRKWEEERKRRQCLRKAMRKAKRINRIKSFIAKILIWPKK